MSPQTDPSYYFTLFKKFQVLGHSYEVTPIHGGAPGQGTFSLTSPDGPNSPFGTSASPLHSGVVWLGSSKSTSPLWGILNARATGVVYQNPPGTTWSSMPTGSGPPGTVTPPAWNAFQIIAASPNTLVDVFGSWIDSGKVKDIPHDIVDPTNGAIKTTLVPATVPTSTTATRLFVCSASNDEGSRPSAIVPSDFWAHSLIFLVDPSNGDTATPASLIAKGEWWVAAVIGNPTGAAAGRYKADGTNTGIVVQAQSNVLVWNTGASPMVTLPALSNLDPAAIDGTYEVYFIGPRKYEVVGFRLPVQAAFDGLAKAIDDSGMDLGGAANAAAWLTANGAHLCVRVRVRKVTDTWPAWDESPLTNSAIAQKNLVPFGLSMVVSANPNIAWTVFLSGMAMKMAKVMFDKSAGRQKLKLLGKLPEGVLAYYLAIPVESFRRWFDGEALHGWRVVAASHEGEVILPVEAREVDDLDEFRFVGARWPGERILVRTETGHEFSTPFPECVILKLERGGEDEAWIDLPDFGEEYLAMALGIEYDVDMLKPGPLGDLSLVQTAAVPVLVEGDDRRKCYELQEQEAGGFTLQVEATDWRQGDPRYVHREGRFWLKAELEEEARDLQAEGYGE